MLQKFCVDKTLMVGGGAQRAVYFQFVHLINRLNVLNGHIKFEWMNLSMEGFKIKVKNLFEQWPMKNVNNDTNDNMTNKVF